MNMAGGAGDGWVRDITDFADAVLFAAASKIKLRREGPGT
jgi:hypothetical protein